LGILSLCATVWQVVQERFQAENEAPLNSRLEVVASVVDGRLTAESVNIISAIVAFERRTSGYKAVFVRDQTRSRSDVHETNWYYTGEIEDYMIDQVRRPPRFTPGVCKQLYQTLVDVNASGVRVPSKVDHDNGWSAIPQERYDVLKKEWFEKSLRDRDDEKEHVQHDDEAPMLLMTVSIPGILANNTERFAFVCAYKYKSNSLYSLAMYMMERTTVGEWGVFREVVLWYGF
jgi:hypothetical protein